jgi:hypothetical protein
MYSLGFEVLDCRHGRKIGEGAMNKDTLPETEPAFVNSRLVVANVSSVSTIKRQSSSP